MADRIYLADKATVDSIKSDTQNIWSRDIIKNSSVVKSVQRGVTSSDGEVTISSVVVNKSVVIVTNVGSDPAQATIGSVELLSSTKLKIVVPRYSTIHWQVLEFY